MTTPKRPQKIGDKHLLAWVGYAEDLERENERLRAEEGVITVDGLRCGEAMVRSWRSQLALAVEALRKYAVKPGLYPAMDAALAQIDSAPVTQDDIDAATERAAVLQRELYGQADGPEPSFISGTVSQEWCDACGEVLPVDHQCPEPSHRHRDVAREIALCWPQGEDELTDMITTALDNAERAARVDEGLNCQAHSMDARREATRAALERAASIATQKACGPDCRVRYVEYGIRALISEKEKT